jgi:hypothetical protein
MTRRSRTARGSGMLSGSAAFGAFESAPKPILVRFRFVMLGTGGEFVFPSDYGSRQKDQPRRDRRAARCPSDRHRAAQPAAGRSPYLCDDDSVPGAVGIGEPVRSPRPRQARRRRPARQGAAAPPSRRMKTGCSRSKRLPHLAVSRSIPIARANEAKTQRHARAQHRLWESIAWVENRPGSAWSRLPYQGLCPVDSRDSVGFG